MPKKPRPEDLPEPQQVPVTRRDNQYDRDAGNPIIVAARVARSFILDTDAGPVVVTYGKRDAGHRIRDTFQARHRSTDLSSSTLAHLREQIAQTEAAYLDKREQAKVRSAVALDPIPAYLLDPSARPILRHRHGSIPPAAAPERVNVRGIDQRSGDLLITRENGDKESVPASRLLRDLDRDELRDIVVATGDYRGTLNALNSHGAKLTDALAGVQVDLVVDIDPDTGERLTVHEGRTIRGATEDNLVLAVTKEKLHAAGYEHVITSTTSVETIAAQDSTFALKSGLLRDQAAADAFARDVTRVAHATEKLKALIEDYAFDATLVTGQQATAAPAPQAEDQPTVPRIAAPTVEPDWED